MSIRLSYVYLGLVLIMQSCIGPNGDGQIDILKTSIDTINIFELNGSDSVIVNFELYNLSKTKTIEIKQISSECGCVSVNTTFISINPLSKNSINILYKPEEKDKGSVIKTIGLLTNLEPPIRFLYLKAIIIR